MSDYPAVPASGKDPEKRGDEQDSLSSVGKDFKDALIHIFLPILTILAAMWAVQVISVLTGSWLRDTLGLVPRDPSGLPGIIFTPLLHSGWSHLIGNSLSWLFLGFMVALVTRRFVPITASIWLLSGVLLWIGGTTGVHIGASGVIYGFAAFLITYGWAQRRPLAVIVAVVVALLHGLSMVAGMLPFNSLDVSWTGHLFGAVAGVLVALWETRTVRQKRQKKKAQKILDKDR